MLGQGLLSEPWFVWGLGLVAGFPLLVLVFGELAHQFERRGSSVAPTLRLIRNVVLPVAVVFLFLRFVIEEPSTSFPSRIASTGLWIVGIAVLLSAVSSIVFGPSAPPDSRRGRAPRLFVDILRVTVIVVASSLVVGAVWGVDLGALFAALGIGGIAIGLALQDTLGSLMGGIALLSEKPFEVGDWVEVDGLEGKVTDINWRTVRIVTRQEDMVVIPNITFGTQRILNNSKPDLMHVEVVPLGFSYSDPPTKVHEVMLQVARETPDVMSDPAPRMRTVGHGSSSVDYECWIWMPSYDIQPDVRSDFLSRAWYAAQREGLTIPFPMRTVEIHQATDMAATAHEGSIERRTRVIERIDPRPDLVSLLLAHSTIVRYGKNERLAVEGESTTSMAIVLEGTASASVNHGDPEGTGEPVTVMRLDAGDMVGAATVLTTGSNLMTITAETEMEVVVIEPEAARTLADRNPAFAAQMDQLLQARRAAIQRAIGSHTTS